MVGFCKAEENANGPLHAYPFPPFEVKLILEPLQTVGLFVTITGSGFTVIVLTAVVVQPLALVPVTV
jgi:hypothetical protein